MSSDATAAATESVGLVTKASRAIYDFPTPAPVAAARAVLQPYFFPIAGAGAVATAGAIVGGMYAMSTKNARLSVQLQRFRIYGQFSTVTFIALMTLIGGPATKESSMPHIMTFSDAGELHAKHK